MALGPDLYPSGARPTFADIQRRLKSCSLTRPPGVRANIRHASRRRDFARGVQLTQDRDDQQENDEPRNPA